MLRSPVPGSVLALVGPVHWGPWCGTARHGACILAPRSSALPLALAPWEASQHNPPA